MGFGKQLLVVLWKNVLLKKRRPLLLIFEFLWPVLLFLVVLAIRSATFLEVNVPCHSTPIALPSAGLVPLLQSFMCTQTYSCANDTVEFPLYKNAKLNAISKSLDPIMHNRRRREALGDLSYSLQYLQDILSGLNTTDARDLLDRNFTVRTFLRDPQMLRQYIVNEIGALPGDTVDAVYDSRINAGKLFHMTLSEDCDPHLLKQVLILPANTILMPEEIGQQLCAISADQRQQIVRRVLQSLNTPELLHMSAQAARLLGDANLQQAFDSIANMILTTEQSKALAQWKTTFDQLQAFSGWLPDMLRLMNAARDSELDLGFLQTIVDDIEPVLTSNRTSHPQLGLIKRLIRYGDQIFKWLRYNTVSNDSTAQLADLFSDLDAVKQSLSRGVSDLTTDELSAFLKQRFSAEKIDKLTKVRNEQDLQDFFCSDAKQSDIVNSLSSQFEATQNALCKAGPGLWLELKNQLNLGEALSKIAEQRKWERYRAADTMEQNGQMEQDLHTMVDYLNNTQTWIFEALDNFRFEPLLRDLHAIAANNLTQTDSGQLSQNILTKTWSLVNRAMENNKIWEDLKRIMYGEYRQVKWLEQVLRDLPVKRLSFGGIFTSNVTMDDLIKFVAERLPVFLAADLSAEPTDEMQQLMASNPSPDQVRYAYCVKPGIVHLLKLDPSIDRQKLTDLSQAICRFNADRFVNEIRQEYHLDDLPNTIRQANMGYSNFSVSDLYKTKTNLQEEAHQFFLRWEKLSQNVSVDWSAISQAVQNRYRDPGHFGDRDQNPTGLLKSLLSSDTLQNTAGANNLGTIVQFAQAVNAEFGRYLRQSSTNGTYGQAVRYQIYYTPYVQEMFLWTMASSEKVNALANVPSLKDAFCNYFSHYFVLPNIPPEIDWDQFRNYVCTLDSSDLKDMQSTISTTSPELDNILRRLKAGDLASNAYNGSTLNSIVDSASNKLEQITEDSSLLWNQGAPAYDYTRQKKALDRLMDTLSSGSVEYYFDLGALFLKTGEQLSDSKEIGKAQTFGEKLLKIVQLNVNEFNRRMRNSISSNMKLTDLLPNEGAMLQFLQQGLPLTDDFARSLQNMVINPQKLLDRLNQPASSFPQNCDDINVREWLSFPPEAEGQANQLAHFLCHNNIFDNFLRQQERFEMQAEGNWSLPLNYSQLAQALSEAGRNLQSARDSLNRRQSMSSQPLFADVPNFTWAEVQQSIDDLETLGTPDIAKLGAEIMDAFQPEIENTVVNNDALKSLWNGMKVATLYVHGQAVAMQDSLNVMRQHEGQVISFADLFDSSAVAQQWKLFERLPDITELVLNSMLAYPDRFQDLSKQVERNSSDLRNILCSSEERFTYYFPAIASNPGTTAREVMPVVCNMEENTKQIAVEQQTKNPELYASAEAASSILRGEPLYGLPVNFTWTLLTLRNVGQLYEDMMRGAWSPPEIRLVDTVYDPDVWQRMLDRVNVSRYLYDGQLSDHAMLFARNVAPLLNPYYEQLGWGPVFATINYFLVRFKARLDGVQGSSVTMSQLLKNEPELLKAVDIADKYALSFADVALYSASEKSYELSKLIDLPVDMLQQRVCRNYSAYFSVPPYRSIDINGMFSDLCALNWTRVGVEAVKFADPKNVNPEDTYSNLSKQFASMRKVDVSATIDNATLLFDTFDALQRQNPQFASNLQLTWTKVSQWNDVGESYIRYISQSNKWYKIVEAASPLLEQLVPGRNSLNSYVRSLALTTDELSNKLRLMNGDELSLRALYPGASELQKVGYIFDNGLQIMNLLTDAIENGKLFEFFERVTASNPLTTFCNETNIGLYFMRSINSNVDPAEVQRSLCNIDFGALQQQLSHDSLSNQWAQVVQSFENPSVYRNNSGANINQLIESAHRVQENTDRLSMNGGSGNKTTRFRVMGGTSAQWEDALQRFTKKLSESDHMRNDFGNVMSDATNVMEELANHVDGSCSAEPQCRTVILSYERSYTTCSSNRSPMCSLWKTLGMDARMLDVLVQVVDYKLTLIQGKPTITINDLFPSSIYTREYLRQMMPVLPSLAKLVLPSITASTPGTRMPNFTSIDEVKRTVCSSSSKLSDFMPNPALSDAELEGLKPSFCFLVSNYDSISRELETEINLPALEATFKNDQLNINWTSLSTRFKGLVTKIGDLARARPHFDLPGNVTDLGIWRNAWQQWLNANQDIDNTLASLSSQFARSTMQFDDPALKDALTTFYGSLRSLEVTLAEYKSRSLRFSSLVPSRFTDLRAFVSDGFDISPSLLEALLDMKSFNQSELQTLISQPSSYYNSHCLQRTSFPLETNSVANTSELERFLCKQLLNDTQRTKFVRELESWIQGSEFKTDFNSLNPRDFWNVSKGIFGEFQRLLRDQPSFDMGYNAQEKWENAIKTISSRMDAEDFASFRSFVNSVVKSLKNSPTNVHDSAWYKAIYPYLAAVETWDRKFPNLLNITQQLSLGSLQSVDFADNMQTVLTELAGIMNGTDMFNDYSNTVNALPSLLRANPVMESSDASLPLNAVLDNTFDVTAWMQQRYGLSGVAANAFARATVKLSPLLRHGTAVFCDQYALSSAIIVENPSSATELGTLMCQQHYPEIVDELALHINFQLAYAELLKQYPGDDRLGSFMDSLPHGSDMKSFMESHNMNNISTSLQAWLSAVGRRDSKSVWNEAVATMQALRPGLREWPDVLLELDRFAEATNLLLASLNRRVDSLRKGRVSLESLVGDVPSLQRSLNSTFGLSNQFVDMLLSSEVQISKLEKLADPAEAKQLFCKQPLSSWLTFNTSRFSEDDAATLQQDICRLDLERLRSELMNSMEAGRLAQQIEQLWSGKQAVPEPDWKAIFNLGEKLVNQLNLLVDSPPMIDYQLEDAVHSLESPPAVFRNPRSLLESNLLPLAGRLVENLPSWRMIRQQLLSMQYTSQEMTKQWKPLADIGLTFATISRSDDLTRDLMDRAFQASQDAAQRLVLDQLSYQEERLGQQTMLSQLVCDPQWVMSAFNNFDIKALQVSINLLSQRMCNEQPAVIFTVLVNSTGSYLKALAAFQAMVEHMRINAQSSPLDLLSNKPLDWTRLLQDVQNYVDVLDQLRGYMSWSQTIQNTMTDIHQLSNGTLDFITKRTEEIFDLYDLVMKRDPNVSATYDPIKKQLLAALNAAKRINILGEQGLGSDSIMHEATEQLAMLANNFWSPSSVETRQYLYSASTQVIDPLTRDRLVEACEAVENNLQSSPDSSLLAVLKKAVELASQQISKLDDYKRLACGMSDMSTQQLYDRTMYGLGWLDILRQLEAVKTESSKTSKTTCPAIVDELTKTSVGFRDAVMSKTGRDLIECLGREENLRVARSVDKYLDVASSVTRLMRAEDGQSFLLSRIQTLEPILRQVMSAIDDQKIATIVLKDYLLNLDKLPPSDDTMLAQCAVNIVSMSVDANKVLSVTRAEEMSSILCSESDKSKCASRLCAGGNEQYLTQLSNFAFENLNTDTLQRDLPKLQSRRTFDADTLSRLAQDGGLLAHYWTSSLGDLNFSNQFMQQAFGLLKRVLYGGDFGKLQSTVKGLLGDFRGLLGSSGAAQDFEALVNGLDGVDKIRKLTLNALDEPVPFSLLFSNLSRVETVLLDAGLPSTLVAIGLYNGSVQLSQVVQNVDMSYYTLFCDPDKLKTIVSGVDAYAANLSAVLCALGPAGSDILLSRLTRELNPTVFLRNLLQADIASQYERRGESRRRARSIVQSLESTSDVLPVLGYILRDIKSTDCSQKQLRTNHSHQATNVTHGLHTVSCIVCGHGPSDLMMTSAGVNIKRLRSAKEMERDRSEISQLPAGFCHNMYMSMTEDQIAGRVMWQYIKPMLRGYIAVAPDTDMTREIAREANETFQEIYSWMTLFKASANVGAKWTILGQQENGENRVAMIKDSLQQPFVQDFLKEGLGIDARNLLSALESTASLDNAYISQLQAVAATLGNVSECLLLNRFRFYKNREALEESAKVLDRDGNLLAAVIFDDEAIEESTEKKRSKRVVLPPIELENKQSWHLPEHVRYTLRMDVRHVPRTDQMSQSALYFNPQRLYKTSEYQLGFIQVQDMLDQAIVRLQARQLGRGDMSHVAMYYQSFPHPCHKDDDMILYLKHWLPGLMVLATLVIFVIRIRDYVLENPVQLRQLMKVMGLRTGVRWVAWFLCSLVSMFVSCLVIVAVLKLGGILPSSSCAVTLAMVFACGVSLMGMSFLISVFFTRTTQAALSGVIIYFLALLPFLTVNMTHAWETSLWLRILTSFSAPSAFGYACTQLSIWEQRSIGIQWSNVGQSPIPGDHMTFTMCCAMLVVDAVLYFVLGCYFSCVFSNNGSSQSLSLWQRLLLWNRWKHSANNMTEPPEASYVREAAHTGWSHPLHWHRFFSWRDAGPAQTSTAPFPLHNDLFLPSSSVTDPNAWVLRKATSSAIVENVDVHKKFAGITLRNLTKTYQRGQTPAVDNLTLDFYDGEITAFLGHNGAGKTSTINVLTGIFAPSSGDAWIYGKRLATEFNEIKKQLGVCFQQNVLFDDLSVRDHLQFYTALKDEQMTRSEIQAEVDRILTDTGLADRQNDLARTLSGGLKRRLCVAIAFLCGSRVVVLDEPTAGIDPVARRQIWSTISKLKQGRTVVLCTHYLDEAELISDRIAIIHRGRLLCSGSGSFLKDHFGSGYRISLTRDTQTALKDVASSQVAVTTSMENVVSLVKNHAAGASLVDVHGRTITIALPHQDEGTMKAMFDELDSKREELGIVSCGLQDSCLEEVFLVVLHLANNEQPLCATLPDRWKILQEAKSGYLEKPVETGLFVPAKQDTPAVKFDETFLEEASLSGMALKAQQFVTLMYKRLTHSRRDWRMLVSGFILPLLFVSAAMAFNLLRPAEVTYPPLTLSPRLYDPGQKIGFTIEQNSPVTRQFARGLLASAGVRQSDFSQKRNILDGTLRECKCTVGKQICPAGAEMVLPPSASLGNNSVLQDLSDVYQNADLQQFISFARGDYTSRRALELYFMQTYQESIDTRVGSLSFGLTDRVQNDTGSNVPFVTIWHQLNALHAIPSFYSGASNALLQSILPDDSSRKNFGITTVNHPFSINSEKLSQENLIQKITDVGISLVFLCAYSFIPSSLIIYLVQERVSKEKQLQMLAGVGPLMYWTVSIVWDFSFYLVSVIIGVLIMSIFRLSIYTAGLNLPATTVLLALYGWACLPIMYLIQRRFKDATVAYMILFCACVFVGVNTLFSVMLLSIFQFTLNLHLAFDLARSIFMLFPQYCLCGGLIELARNQLQSEILQKVEGTSNYSNPFSTNVVGWHIISMLIQGVFFFLLNVFIEARVQVVSCTSVNNDERKKNYREEPADIRAERESVIKMQKSYLMRLVGLKKYYQTWRAKKLAVDDLYLGIEPGECFALLGLNGAGKTTSFQMLTGGVQPSKGCAYLANKSLTGMDFRAAAGQLGYCPQEDACDLLLTGREVLTVHAKLKGFTAANLQKTVDSWLLKLDLNKHADMLVKAYSGGTKRKLSSAVALLGKPLVVLMDEPTSGMDASSKRLVWQNVLSVIKDGRSVVLTSHSMEECEALCTRMAILVNGRMECIGSVPQLRNRFAHGYTLKLRCSDDHSMATLKQCLRSALPGAHVKEDEPGQLELGVSAASDTGPGHLSTIFSHLADLKGLALAFDYSITETSLDQVYVSFAKRQSDIADL